MRNADEILVMDRGQIVEQGSHDALVATGGIYAKMVARQTGGGLASNIDVRRPTWISINCALPNSAVIPHVSCPCSLVQGQVIAMAACTVVSRLCLLGQAAHASAHAEVPVTLRRQTGASMV